MATRLSSVFLHSPVGRAHLEASRAVSAALGGAWRREELDFLDFLPAFERWLWPSLYHLVVRHAPALWRAWRRVTDRIEPRALRDRARGGMALHRPGAAARIAELLEARC